MSDSVKSNLKTEAGDNANLGNNVGTCKKLLVYLLLTFFILESLFLEIYQLRSALIEYGTPSGIIWPILIFIIFSRVMSLCFRKIIIYIILLDLLLFLDDSPLILRTLRDLFNKFK